MENKLTLVHYSDQEELKEINPLFKGTGVDCRTKGRDSWHPHSFFYLDGTQPEEVVVSRSKVKYKTSLDLSEQPIYDIGIDKEGIIAKTITDNFGAFNMELVHKELKERGFHGFLNSIHPHLPNVVVLYKAMEVEKYERLR